MSLMNRIEDIATADPKRVRILDGAMKVFLAYGFSRTTMDDIARAADMSRPALYLLFKNKTDIFRAIAMMILSRSVEAAKMALDGDSAFPERMMRAIDEAFISMMSAVVASPHGAELLERLAPTQAQVNDVQFGCLGTREFHQLLDMVQRLVDSSDRAIALQRYLADTNVKQLSPEAQSIAVAKRGKPRKG